MNPDWLIQDWDGIRKYVKIIRKVEKVNLEVPNDRKDAILGLLKAMGYVVTRCFHPAILDTVSKPPGVIIKGVDESKYLVCAEREID